MAALREFVTFLSGVSALQSDIDSLIDDALCEFGTFEASWPCDTLLPVVAGSSAGSGTSTTTTAAISSSGIPMASQSQTGSRGGADPYSLFFSSSRGDGSTTPRCTTPRTGGGTVPAGSTVLSQSRTQFAVEFKKLQELLEPTTELCCDIRTRLAQVAVAQGAVSPLPIHSQCLTLTPTQVYVVLSVNIQTLLHRMLHCSAAVSLQQANKEQRGDSSTEAQLALDLVLSSIELEVKMLEELFPAYCNPGGVDLIKGLILLFGRRDAEGALKVLNDCWDATLALTPVTSINNTSSRSPGSTESSRGLGAEYEPDLHNLRAIAYILLGNGVAAAGVATAAVEAAKKLSDDPKGWRSARGSRALCLAYLLRAEGRKITLTDAQWVEDVHRAVKESEQAKVFSGLPLDDYRSTQLYHRLLFEYCGSCFLSSRSEVDQAQYTFAGNGGLGSASSSMSGGAKVFTHHDFSPLFWHRYQHVFRADCQIYTATDSRSSAAEPETAKLPILVNLVDTLTGHVKPSQLKFPAMPPGLPSILSTKPPLIPSSGAAPGAAAKVTVPKNVVPNIQPSCAAKSMDSSEVNPATTTSPRETPLSSRSKSFSGSASSSMRKLRAEAKAHQDEEGPKLTRAASARRSPAAASPQQKAVASATKASKPTAAVPPLSLGGDSNKTTGAASPNNARKSSPRSTSAATANSVKPRAASTVSPRQQKAASSAPVDATPPARVVTTTTKEAEDLAQRLFSTQTGNSKRNITQAPTDTAQPRVRPSSAKAVPKRPVSATKVQPFPSNATQPTASFLNRKLSAPQPGKDSRPSTFQSSLRTSTSAATSTPPAEASSHALDKKVPLKVQYSDPTRVDLYAATIAAILLTASIHTRSRRKKIELDRIRKAKLTQRRLSADNVKRFNSASVAHMLRNPSHQANDSGTAASTLTGSGRAMGGKIRFVPKPPRPESAQPSRKTASNMFSGSSLYGDDQYDDPTSGGPTISKKPLRPQSAPVRRKAETTSQADAGLHSPRSGFEAAPARPEVPKAETKPATLKSESGLDKTKAGPVTSSTVAASKNMSSSQGPSILQQLNKLDLPVRPQSAKIISRSRGASTATSSANHHPSDPPASSAAPKRSASAASGSLAKGWFGDDEDDLEVDAPSMVIHDDDDDDDLFLPDEGDEDVDEFDKAWTNSYNLDNTQPVHQRIAEQRAKSRIS